MSNNILQLQLRKETSRYRVNEHGVVMEATMAAAYIGKYISFYVKVAEINGRWCYGKGIDIRIPGITSQGHSSPCMLQYNYPSLSECMQQASMELWDIAGAKHLVIDDRYKRELDKCRLYYLLSDFLNNKLLIKAQ